MTHQVERSVVIPEQRQNPDSDKIKINDSELRKRVDDARREAYSIFALVTSARDTTRQNAGLDGYVSASITFQSLPASMDPTERSGFAVVSVYNDVIVKPTRIRGIGFEVNDNDYERGSNIQRIAVDYYADVDNEQGREHVACASWNAAGLEGDQKGIDAVEESLVAVLDAIYSSANPLDAA